jgi:hypothetical protein
VVLQQFGAAAVRNERLAARAKHEHPLVPAKPCASRHKVRRSVDTLHGQRGGREAVTLQSLLKPSAAVHVVCSHPLPPPPCSLTACVLGALTSPLWSSQCYHVVYTALEEDFAAVLASMNSVLHRAKEPERVCFHLIVPAGTDAGRLCRISDVHAAANPDRFCPLRKEVLSQTEAFCPRAELMQVKGLAFNTSVVRCRRPNPNAWVSVSSVATTGRERMGSPTLQTLQGPTC